MQRRGNGVLPCGGFLQRRDPAETRGNSAPPEFCQKRFVENWSAGWEGGYRHFVISIVKVKRGDEWLCHACAPIRNTSSEARPYRITSVTN
jgi:hypothetical protein